jgi:hypothetical protein
MIQSVPPSGAGLLRPVRPSFSRELPEAMRQRDYHLMGWAMRGRFAVEQPTITG